eukprot:scaffold559150_cov47-Prasinocladus_malaysianus.AAC.1
MAVGTACSSISSPMGSSMTKAAGAITRNRARPPAESIAAVNPAAEKDGSNSEAMTMPATTGISVAYVVFDSMAPRTRNDRMAVNSGVVAPMA